MFESVDIYQNIFGCKVIEFKFNFENQHFRLIVKNYLLAQFNLTNHEFDENGRMDYYFYKPKISITNINIDEYITILPTGNCYI